MKIDVLNIMTCAPRYVELAMAKSRTASLSRTVGRPIVSKGKRRP